MINASFPKKKTNYLFENFLKIKIQFLGGKLTFGFFTDHSFVEKTF